MSSTYMYKRGVTSEREEGLAGGRDLIRRIPAYTCRHPQILFPEGQNQSCMFWRIKDGNETFCDFLLSAGAESVSENVSLFFTKLTCEGRGIIWLFVRLMFTFFMSKSAHRFQNE